jgi:hypothetical protein
MSQTLTAPSPALNELRCICGHLFNDHPKACPQTAEYVDERQQLREREVEIDFPDLTPIHRCALLRARQEFPGRRAYWREEFRRLRASRKGRR